jgi:hypothetical protein
MTNTYIVYKRISPPGHAYVGYTSGDLMKRWRAKINEVKGTSLPLANALQKYGTACWKHEIILTTQNIDLAKQTEIEMIAKCGYYNIAKGGDGGDTGRNKEQSKRDKHSKDMVLLWKGLSQEEKDNRALASINTRIKNETLGNCNPLTGTKHGNWSGWWVISNKRYETISDACNALNINQSTIMDLCVRKVDRTWTRSSKLVDKNKTPRQMGHYKELA